MASRKISDEDRTALKNAFGYSDEEVGIILENPKQFELFQNFRSLFTKKMVATCIKAENCAMNKIGDRYVFTAAGQLVKDETCDRPCLWAMSNFFPFSYILYDRAASGLDLEGMHFEHVSCPDTGCQHGGYGNAMFMISVEYA